MPVEGQTGVAPDGTPVIFRGGKAVPINPGPKARSDWGSGAVELPDGSIVRYGPKGGTTVLKKAGGGASGGLEERPDLREFEINAAARATLMDEGIAGYEEAKAAGFKPNTLRNTLARGLEGLGQNFGPYIADVIRDDPAEKARAAELQFTDGALRTTSGANAPEPEVRRASRAYFRQPGEGDAAEAQRAAVRDRFRSTAIRAAGAAYIPSFRTGPGSMDQPLDLTSGQSRATIPKGAYYRDPAGNLRRNDNADKGNPIFKRAKPAGPPKTTGGYKILSVE